MLTIESLTAELGLNVSAGDGAAGESEIRWVHITELLDPTPWLSGGELLLTTGIRLENAEKQRKFIRLLADSGVAGLGFGTGFDHAKIPKAVLSEAKACHFPVFEVPYETPVHSDHRGGVQPPGERAVRRALPRDRGERAPRAARPAGRRPRRGRARDRRRGRAAARSCSTREARSWRTAGASSPSTWSTRFARRCSPVGRPPRPSCRARPDLRGRALAHPVSPRAGAAEAWLVVVRRSGELGDFERLCVQQAAIVVALELMRERVARETERRLSGEVLAATLSGRLAADDIRDRLAPFGIGERALVLAFELGDAAAAEPTLGRVSSRARTARRWSRRTRPGAASCSARSSTGAREILSSWRPRPARRWRRRTARPAPRPAARCRPSGSATPSTRLAAPWRRPASPTARPPRWPPTAISARSRCCSRSRTARRSASIARACSGRSRTPTSAMPGSCLRSLEAYIDRNGHWERAASDCYCHRHTLRYRIKRIEELTGRDLSRANDRVELWLALRAKELIGREGRRPRSRRDDRAGDRPRPRGVRGGHRDAPPRPRSATAPRRWRTSTEAARPRRARPTRPATSPTSSTGWRCWSTRPAYRINLAAMRACLDAGCHYMDLGGLYHVTAEQLELSEEFEQRGLLALLGIGSAPGQDQPARGAGGARLEGSPVVDLGARRRPRPRPARRAQLPLRHADPARRDHDAADGAGQRQGP